LRIEAGIKYTDIKETVITDSSGSFKIEMVGPEEEGNYTFYLKAEKDTYSKYDSEFEIKVYRVNITLPNIFQIQSS